MIEQKKDKSVGLITIHNIINFGSILQTYATYKSVTELGYDCKVIDYKYPNRYHIRLLKSQGEFTAQSIVRSAKTYLINLLTFPNAIIQKRKFRNFLKEELTFTQVYKNIREISAKPPFFDIYLTGSDQVWNPKYLNEDTTFLLSFVSEKAKKIAYGASFGSSVLPDQYHDLYKHHLKSYSHISVREKSGITVIEELTSQGAQNVLDPTLLLSGEQWDKIGKPLHIKNKYILCYLVNYMFSPYPFAYELIDRIKELTGFDVIIIGGSYTRWLKSGYKIKNSVGPEEFLTLVSNASFVITSSFHGIAFSINYSKPFYLILNRNPNTDDRGISLLRSLGIEDRAIIKDSPLPRNLDMEVDFTLVNNRLNELRKASIDFLREALDG